MNRLILVMVMSIGFIASGCGGGEQNQTTAGQSGMQGTAISQQTVSDVAKKAQDLLTQAKKYLDEGKFDQAISVAQNVLSFDPKNLDAQKIIDIAKAKLKAFAEQKAAEVKSGVMNKLGTLGQ